VTRDEPKLMAGFQVSSAKALSRDCEFLRSHYEVIFGN
jgi:hypothetical protein